MHSNNRFGLLSLVCGITSSSLFFAFSYFSLLGRLKGGNILSMLDRLGFINKERGYVAELRAGSVFAIDDANALLWLTWLAFILVFAAVALALYAKREGESTLYIAAGFIVATVGVGLVYPAIMLLIQVVGMLVFIRINSYIK